ncbi:phosphotransferase enzyme family protein [Pedobacter sp. Hv1]|uniref:phosphotransferase enzyme family protein n=1 Tax=Pedobacter sp. Hv1 TaxID=1740090 RepID=UPI00137919EC|nr:phosphotransferase [Pedobacter sp. Hv1]
MAIFPTQYSTLSSVALKDFLSLKYGLKGTNCRLLIHNVSDTYILESEQEKYIFKIYRDAHRKLAEIEAEVELLTILNAKGAKVSYPITALDGAQIQSFNAAEGTRYGVLFTFAKGEVVHDLTDEHLKTLGKEMALVHQISSSIELKNPRKAYNVDTLLLQPLAVFKPAFEDLEEEYAYLTTVITKVVAEMEQLDLTKFSYGYCHYDFLPKNFHFESANALTFFDFDFAGQGHLVNDIASFYVHYFMEVMNGKMTQQEADRAFAVFVESYRTIRPLSDEELKAIPYFGFAFWIFYLGFQYENFDDWSSLFFGPKFLKQRVGVIKQWMDWYIN